MDTRIEQGDFVVDTQGYPAAIYGVDELFQRAAFLFSLKKGTFIYDRELGVDWYDYPRITSGGGEELLMLLREAAADYSDIKVDEASFRAEQLNSFVSFSLEGYDGMMEVRVRA